MTADARRARLRSALPDDVEAVLLTHPVNVRWATGFSGSVAALLLPRDAGAEPVLAVDGRYTGRAAAEASGVRILASRTGAPDLLREAAAGGLRRVAVEADRLTVTAAGRLSAAAAEAGSSVIALPALVEPLRAEKDADELASLRRACAITDAAFDRVVPQLRPGATERDVEWLLLAAMRECGADGPAFDAIVAAGPGGAEPHHAIGDRPLAPGDLLTLDFGARVAGQHADMTRTVAIGVPAGWQRELHATVLGIQAELADRCREGAVPAELDAQAAALVAAAGGQVAHGLGHGVGLEVHEEPWLTPGSASPPLVAGTPLTVEPGMYLDGRGGVRIEDTALVVADGGCEPLTRSTRELLVL